MKLIIAPHVIDENHLVEIIGKLKRPYVRYTRADEKNVLKADCLIIDCFGLLSSIYRYGEIAYIGGGFGVVFIIRWKLPCMVSLSFSGRSIRNLWKPWNCWKRKVLTPSKITKN